MAATAIAIGTASIAGQFTNIMDYLQTLFGFFNAPLFATFILGMFWKRMTPTAGWMGLVAGTLSASSSRPGRGAFELGRRRRSCPGRARPSWRPPSRSSSTSGSASWSRWSPQPKPADQLVGLVYSETPKDQRTDPMEHTYPWYRRTLPLAGLALAMVIVLNVGVLRRTT